MTPYDQGLADQLDDLSLKTTSTCEKRDFVDESPDGQLKYEDTKMGGFQAKVRDTADRKRSEEQREEIALRYLELFENAQDFIYTHDLDGFYTSVNQAAKTMFGYETEEFLKLNFRDIVAEDHLETVDKNFRRKTLHGETVTGPYEIRVKTKDGSYKWVEVLSRVIMDGSRPIGVHGSARDVTTRKIAQENLKKSEAMYRALFDCAHDSIFVLDGNVFLDCNEKTLRAFGCSREQLIGKSPWHFSPAYQPDGSLSEVKAKQKISAALNGQSQLFEWRHNTATGKVFEAEVSLNRINNLNEPLLMAIVRDLTNRRKVEKERESLRAQLNQAQKMEAIGTLAGGIAHDFNNLLQIILGYSDLILRKKEEWDHDYESAKAIKSASERGRDLVQRILTFSSNCEAKLAPIDLNSQIVRINDLLQRTIPKMIEIHLDLADRLPPVFADETQIEQILLNLAVNAQYAMKSGGKLTISTCAVALDDTFCHSYSDMSPGQHILLTVSDTGHGIGEQILDRIFEPFFTTKAQGEGTGLGLSMVFGIVKSYGGHIVCSSKPNVGTSFMLYFPTANIQAGELESSQVEVYPTGSELILVVDDEEAILNFVKELLSMVGYNVITSSSPLGAIELFRMYKNEIDMVILDLIMPQMGGKECLENLIRINPDVKAIIASGYASEADERAKILELAKGFVRKPYNTDELLLQIRRVLDT